MTPFTSTTKRKDDTTLYSPETSPTMRKTQCLCSNCFDCAFPALLLLLLTGLLMVSGVGAECVGSLTPRPGEVLVMCNLTEDVRQTKHGVVIMRFPYKGDAVTVLSCDWLSRDPDTPDCISLYDLTLVSLGKDCVVTKFPRTLLQRGSYSYRCNLVPRDKEQPFTTCRVLHSDDAEDPPTTISAVTPSTAADQTEEEPTGANGDHSGGLVPAVVALSFTVFILLLMVIVMAVLFLRPWRNWTQTPVDILGQEDVQVYVPAATCEAEGARQATKPDSETSSEDSESALLGKDGKPLETCCSM